MLSYIRIWRGYNGILPTATENTADADAVTGHPDGGGDGDEIKQVNKQGQESSCTVYYRIINRWDAVK